MAWTQVAGQLNSQENITSLLVFNGNLYGGTSPEGKLFRWNGTDAWTEVADQLNGTTAINALVEFNDNLYGAANGKLFRWNGTDAWTEVADTYAGQGIVAHTVFNNAIYGGTYANGRLFRWDGVSSWAMVADEFNNQDGIYSLCVLGGTLYGGTYDRSRLYAWNGVDSWTQVAAGTTSSSTLKTLVVLDGEVYGTRNQFSSPYGSILKLDGSTWTTVVSSNYYYLDAMIANDGDLYCAAQYQVSPPSSSIRGILLKWNGSDSFEQVCDGFESQTVNCLAVLNGKIYGGTGENGLLLRYSEIVPSSSSYSSSSSFSSNSSSSSSEYDFDLLTRPFLRYSTSLLLLDDNSAPTYPVQEGLELAQGTLSYPKLIVVNRNTPSTSTRWQVPNLKQADRADMWSFWDTTLLRGKYDFTLVDDQKRMLFDTSWNQWKERWVKRNGGLHEVTMDFESPYDWTPPMFAFYSMAQNSLDCHGYGSTLTTGADGTLVAGGDAALLRGTGSGSALRLADNAVSSPIGASATGLTWTSSNGAGSFSFVCQCKKPVMNVGGLNIAILNTGGTTNDSLRLWMNLGYAGIYWEKHGFAGTSVSCAASANIWYDLCGTYDGVNNTMYMMLCPSATGTTWSASDDLFYGLTTLASQCSVNSSPTVPTAVTWTDLSVMYGNGDMNIFTTDNTYAYLQNLMIIDDFTPPLQFNTYRRLFHQWNHKTTAAPV